MARFDATRVAITGAGGFIGTALAHHLNAQGADVIGIDVSPTATARLISEGIEAAVADVTDRPALDLALGGVDVVFHTAALVHEWGSMQEFVRVNVGGTATVLDAATATGVDKVVHVSSVVVYGYDDPGEQDETAQLRTYGIPYIDTKSASDRLARRRGAVVVRPGDVYGPGSIPWTRRPLELAQARQLALPGKGDGQMLPVYVDDLVEALVLAAHEGEPGRAYTVWEGADVSFGDYFDRIAEIAEAPKPRRLPRRVLELAGAASERVAALRGLPPTFTARSATFIDRRGTVSNRRLCEELGWVPTVPLKEGLRRSAEWAVAAGIVGGSGRAAVPY